MSKRRSGDEERDYLLKKIKKLEKRIRRLSDSDEEDNINNDKFEENIDPEYIESEVILNDVVSESVPEERLDDNILEVLGGAPPIQLKDNKLHQDIADRWSEVVTKGLKKEEKEDLQKIYPTFTNCGLNVPKLNPEVGAALNESGRKRDSLIENRQKQLSTALSALGSALESCVKEQFNNKINVIKNINDASKILCDSFYMDTRGRRSLVLSSINKDLKDSLTQTEPQTFLFGENLSEKIRNAKSVQKSGEDLKIKTTNKFVQKPQDFKNPSSSANLNWRGPPRLGRPQKPAVGGPANRGRIQRTKGVMDKNIHRRR